jgi:organic radical activating enzyme
MCGGVAENAELCRYGARVFSSREMTAEEVMKTILMDRPFYKNGGGVTFSGGEPCCQPDFLMELLALCRKEKVSAAIFGAPLVGFLTSKVLQSKDPELDHNNEEKAWVLAQLLFVLSSLFWTICAFNK